MKHALITVCTLFLTINFARAQMSPVRITTEKQQKTKRTVTEQAKTKEDGNTIWHYPEHAEQSQSVVMNVKIQNMTAKNMAGVTVKYVLFGKDKVSNKAKDVARGEKTIDIKSLQTATVETEPVDFESEEVTFRNGQFTERNNRKGNQYYGIAVAVYSGSNKIISYYEPSSLEQQARKLGTEP